ncbi:MAG: PorP/SprF family type IX secretion system membrane protein [Chitinophagales bacterium]|nr:PorP/SprF family type IX secretion system membrane protein [Chitinophagales bacterium]
MTKRYLKTICMTGCIMVFLVYAKGQDPVFSQFYNAHLQLNPALAGNTHGPLFQLNYRNQWPALGNIYTTYAASYDQYISGIKSGLGVSILTDNAGDGTLKTTNIIGYYSYGIKIKNELFVKGGLEAGWMNTYLDWNKLQFGDALDPFSGSTPGGTPIPSQEVPLKDLSLNRLKIGAGVVLYSPKYYVGLSFKNINTPEVSFLGTANSSQDQLSSIPMRISLHAGTQIIISPGNKNVNPTFISPNIMFQKQRDFHQINAGAYISVNKVQGGLWYRHALYNGDALIASFGVRQDFFKITYSFDMTMSSLGLSQGGSHELGLVLNFNHLTHKSQNYNDCFAIFR